MLNSRVPEEAANRSASSAWRSHSGSQPAVGHPLPMAAQGPRTEQYLRSLQPHRAASLGEEQLEQGPGCLNMQGSPAQSNHWWHLLATPRPHCSRVNGGLCQQRHWVAKLEPLSGNLPGLNTTPMRLLQRRGKVMSYHPTSVSRGQSGIEADPGVKWCNCTHLAFLLYPNFKTN